MTGDIKDDDSSTTSEEILARDRKVTRLIEFAEREILDVSKRPPGVGAEVFTGGWWPSFKWGAKSVIPFLNESIEGVAKRAQKEHDRKPNFIDLGSGEGMITFIASATERFAHCYGIENRSEVVEWGKTHQATLESEDIVPKSNVSLVAGSYYTAATWQGIASQPMNDFQSSQYATSGQENYLDQTGLLGEDGKLNAEVIYWFPSDPFIQQGADQWGKIIRSGSYLILGPSSQVDILEMTNALQDFELVETRRRQTTDLEDSLIFSKLLVYKKT